MHGLYRCRCVVGYRPYASDRLIVFPERQVASVSMNLKWDPNNVVRNMDQSTEAGQFVNSLTGSTVNVTLSDPYMTGIAWAALFDTAAAYTNAAQASFNNIALPPCEGEQDEKSGKCRNYPTIEDPLLRKGGFADFAHILVKFYYEVKGDRFGLDTYFRLQNFNIQHGKTFPQVTLQGVNPQTVVFNQNLANFKLEENVTLEDNLKKIIEEYGYDVSFCTDPEKKETKTYTMPRSFKEKSVTAAEVIKKYLDSVGGSIQSLPTKEYARKVSLCTRANLNQGCSVFYLGKGLYEGYSISGAVNPNNLALNSEFSTDRGLGYNFDTIPLNENEKYTLAEIKKRERDEKLKSAKRVEVFKYQFDNYDKRYSNRLSSSGFLWREPGPEVTTRKGQSVNLFGVGVNGDKPISILDGLVVSASEDFGRVLIQTNYFFKACSGQDENKKCKNVSIYQESVNLTTVTVKTGDRVQINKEIGTATEEKPEFVRFFIGGGAQGREVTIYPGLVWKYAIPVEKLTDEEKKNLGLKDTEETPSGPIATGQGGTFIGRVGSTGGSSGPHLHAEWEDKRFIDVNQVREFVKISGSVTSTYNDPTRSRHKGVDIGGNNREPIELINGATLAEVVETKCTVENDRNNDCGGGFGNHVIINTPKGRMILAHLAPGSVSPSSSTNVSTGSKFGTGVQAAPSSMGAEINTEFKGIPRALRIIPGRTVLSFITRYDEWVEKGRPAEIDPGVWIAERFSRWMIKDVNYQWSQGDLRVGLSGVTDWGVAFSRIQTPKFEDYLATGDFEFTKDYYGYIRSAGDLCWKLKDGKTSCEVICQEAQQLQNMLMAGQDGGDPSVTSSYPPAQCQYTGSKYPRDRVNAIINAARQGGINTKAGFAGVVGNALVESGVKLSPTAENTDSKAYGIFQWFDGRRQGLERYASSKGASASDFNIQMERFVQELKGADFQGKATVQALNSSSSPEQAAAEFNRLFERAPGQKESERQQYAREIYSGLDCKDT